MCGGRKEEKGSSQTGTNGEGETHTHRASEGVPQGRLRAGMVVGGSTCARRCKRVIDTAPVYKSLPPMGWGWGTLDGATSIQKSQLPFLRGGEEGGRRVRIITELQSSQHPSASGFSVQ